MEQRDTTTLVTLDTLVTLNLVYPTAPWRCKSMLRTLGVDSLLKYFNDPLR